MNEQKKAFILRFAAENDGEWKSECDYAGEYIRSAWQDNMQQTFSYEKGQMIYIDSQPKSPSCSYVVKCTKQEYLDLIGSLFEGAPERATHVDSENTTDFYRNDGNVFYSCEKPFGVRCAKFDKLIPRPRKKPSFIGDALNQAFEQACVEAINKAPNTPTMNDDVSYVCMDGSEWNGSGLPPVWTVCEYKYAQVNEMEFKVGTIKFIGDKLVIIDSGYEQCYHIDSLEFRPLKTEAEKEREAGIKALTEILSKGVGDCEPDEYLATQVWDAGYRLQESK